MTNAADVRRTTHGATANRMAVDVVSPITVTTGAGGAGTSAVTRVPTNVANVTLKAANANRFGLTLQNNSTANLFLKLGATANITAGTESYTVRMVANSYYEVPYGYTGIIDGIWDAADATGEAVITEVTA